jgi:hypothetical protein
MQSLISTLLWSLGKQFSYFMLRFFYAVIDIVRMVVLHPDGAIALHKHFESEKGIIISTILLCDIIL